MASHFFDYGIDLGTTNSSIARWRDDDVHVYMNNEQMLVTPSVVLVTAKGRTHVGKRAKNAAANYPDDTCSEFKRWVGHSDKIEFPASGKSMSAEELSSLVLKELIGDVRRQDGVDLDAAAIGVPAAFSTQQCDATAAAARLAGITEFHLLQEPIAASIAYGLKPGVEDQRWLVFDLGGGTFDVAVMSTRKGRLTVLEHRGDNELGGKDIDQRIVDNLLLPPLAEEFALPSSGEPAHASLLRRLKPIAETTKTLLSTSEEADASVMNVGNDTDGTLIEIDIPVSRRQVDDEAMPLLARAVRLAEEALEAARVSKDDLDRVILVGGVTQMPVLRELLCNRFGAKVDHSLDPMTVVARGAAVYASTAERSSSAVVPVASPGKLTAKIAHDPVSASVSTQVAGRLAGDAAKDISEVKVDAEGGYWTSGWCPTGDGAFEIEVRLREGRTTRFWLYARDGKGQLHDVEQGEFSIRHGLEVAAPPLPASILVELEEKGSTPEFDRLIQRSTPLPATATKKYRTARRLEPGDMGGGLAVKLYEGEALADPEANAFLGSIALWSGQIDRAVPKGEEVELYVQVDASRIITVEGALPRLDVHFRGRVYKMDRPSARDQVKTLPAELAKPNEDLDDLSARLGDGADPGIRAELEDLRRQVHDLQRTASNTPEAEVASDPDRGKQLAEQARAVKAQVGDLRRRAGLSDEADKATQLRERVTDTLELASDWGSRFEIKEAEALQRRFERASSKGDARATEQAADALTQLGFRILFKQPWFWKEVFESMHSREFIDSAEADRWLSHGREAIDQEDLDGLIEAVQHLWDLVPGDAEAVDKQRALRSGLRRY